MVVISQGGENSSLFRRILTSHNFFDLALVTIPKPEFVINESDSNIYIAYRATAGAAWSNLQLNKRASQAWIKRVADPKRFPSNTTVGFDTAAHDPLGLTSESLNPPNPNFNKL